MLGQISKVQASRSWVLDGFKHPVKLRFSYGLGRRLNISSDELRPAIRTLFDATIANLSDEAAVKMTEKWQHHGS